MLIRSNIVLFLILCLNLAWAGGVIAMEQSPTAIVIASFGTTHNSTLDSLLSIVQDTQDTYPETPVRMAFTSNIIRKRWQQRDKDKDYRAQHPQVPESIYQIKNILGALADLQNLGYKTIVVQPTLLTHGEEYRDLQNYIAGLLSISTVKRRWQPFDKISLGRPLLGSAESSHPLSVDLQALAVALADDAHQAEREQSALLYIGHGNEHLSNSIYSEMQQMMTETYPKVKTLIGLVEGHPGQDEVLAELKKTGIDRVLLKPLMIVAGDHAKNDMAGDDENSWNTRLTAVGIGTNPVLKGLGDNPSIRKIFIKHLQDAATEAGIELR